MVTIVIKVREQLTMTRVYELAYLFSSMRISLELYTCHFFLCVLFIFGDRLLVQHQRVYIYVIDVVFVRADGTQVLETLNVFQF